MRVAVFSTKSYDSRFLTEADTVRGFVNDDLSEPVLKRLAAGVPKLLGRLQARLDHANRAGSTGLLMPTPRASCTRATWRRPSRRCVCLFHTDTDTDPCRSAPIVAMIRKHRMAVRLLR